MRGLRQRVLAQALPRRAHMVAMPELPGPEAAVGQPGQQTTAVEVRHAQNLMRPVSICHHIFQSPLNDIHGYLKVAGLLCSKKKCPTQAQA